VPVATAAPVPAAAALATSLPAVQQVGTSMAPAAPVATAAPTAAPVVSTTENILQKNEKYLDRQVNGMWNDRFIKAIDGRAIWFQDAETLTKHLVRSQCKACGNPPPCQNYVQVTKNYISGLTLGEDFECDMLTQPGAVDGHKAVGVETQTSTTVAGAGTTTTTTTTSTQETVGGWGLSMGGVLVAGLVVLCCCGAAAAAYMAMGAGSSKKSKKKQSTRGVSRDEESSSREDQVPLVLGEDGWHSTSFSSQNSGFGGALGQREQAASMAPTYTGMPPQMAQAQMPTSVSMQQPGFPMPTQSWQQQQQLAMQPVPTQGLPTYTGLPAQQASFAAQEQEMELVTVTPTGLAVTPLAPGQQIPQGVPVLTGPPM